MTVNAYVARYTCSEEWANPVGDTDWQYYRWFNSAECHLMPREEFICIVLFTTGFQVVDFVGIVLLDNKTATDYQLLGHHVVLVCATFASMFAGYGVLSNAAITLFCEASSIFLNIRSSFTKDQRDSLPYIFNDVAFFVTYTIFRVGMMTFTFYKTVFESIAMWQFRSYTQRACSVFCTIMAAMLYGVNLFWYRLILRNVAYALQNLGILPKKVKKQD